jgi:hypothetical protein
VYLQINTVKYNAEYLEEFTNSSIPVFHRYATIHLYIFGLLQISICLSVFGFVAYEYKWIAIQSLLTICNIWSGIRWMNPKVKKSVN